MLFICKTENHQFFVIDPAKKANNRHNLLNSAINIRGGVHNKNISFKYVLKCRELFAAKQFEKKKTERELFVRWKLWLLLHRFFKTSLHCDDCDALPTSLRPTLIDLPYRAASFLRRTSFYNRYQVHCTTMHKLTFFFIPVVTYR